MLTAILSLAAFAVPPTGPGLAQTTAIEAPSIAQHPVVVRHHGDPALRDRMLHELDIWHDAGRFFVGEASGETLRWLETLPVDVFHLGDLNDQADLYVIEFTGESTLDRIRGAGGRILYRLAPQALVSLPPESRGVLDEVEPGSFMHHGLTPIARQAWIDPRPSAALRGGPPGLPAAMPADPRIQAIVDLVDVNNVEATVISLSAIHSRRTDQPGSVVAQNQIEAEMQSYGLTTSLQNFGYLSQNVIGELPGLVDPSKIIVIGGHYDSYTNAGVTAPAPGADDNASGTGGVLEAARVMAANGPYEHTLRFIAFSGEEFGLLGSKYAAQLSASLGEDIIAMLNTDMIAYRAGGDALDVDFVTNDSSSNLISYCQQMGAMYVPNWASTTGTLGGGTSDHRSYTQNGFEAVFWFEDTGDHCPYIHTGNDTHPQATNDFTLAEMFVKGVVATAASLAAPVDLQITHVPLGDTQLLGPYDVDCQVDSLIGTTITSANIQYSTDGTNFTPVAMTLQGGNAWQGQIPGAGSPVEISYYLEAFDDQGNSQTLPAVDGGAPPFSFFVGVKKVLYFNDFEATGDEGWTHGMVSTQDDWQRGVPYGKAGDPSSAWSGTKVWGNDLGVSGWNGEYQPNVHNWLASPFFDLSGETNVTLEYRRWLTVEEAQYDQAQIRVNGTVVWQNASGSDHIDSSWIEHSIDISAQAAGNPSVQIEFRLLSDAGVEFGGWNIDDFSLLALGPVGSCPPPTTYCVTSPNSVGPGALIGYQGTTSVSANDLVLTVDQGIPGQFGLFYYGPNQIQIAFGEGYRCVGGGIYRLKVITMDGSGHGTYALDVTNPPEPPGQIDPGETWNFQCWYRDPTGGPSGFNFSDGLEALFCP